MGKGGHLGELEHRVVLALREREAIQGMTEGLSLRSELEAI